MIIFYISAFLFLLPGCRIGPTYKKPILSIPEKYSLSAEEKANKKTALCWWKSFENSFLESLLAELLQNNGDIRIALEKIEESRNLYRIESKKIAPQINIFSEAVGANLGNGFLSNGVPTGTFNSRFMALDMLWELDLWGRLRKNKNAALYEWEAEIESMRDVLVMMSAEFVQTFISLCALYEKESVLEKIILADKKIKSLNNYAFTAGIDNQQAVLAEKIVDEQLKIRAIELLVEQKKAANKLAFLLHISPEKLVLKRDFMRTVPLPRYDISIEKPYELLRRRPDIRKAEKLLASSYEHIGSAVAEWFPTISLLALFGKPATSGGFLRVGNEKIWTVGPLFNWPFIDFGRIRSSIKAKKAFQRQQLISYEKMVIQAIKEVEDWLISYTEELKKTALLKAQLENESFVLERVQDRFLAGIDSEILSLMQQKKVGEKNLDLIDSLEKSSLYFVSLSKAFGGSW